jgi:hypothetical protein
MDWKPMSLLEMAFVGFDGYALILKSLYKVCMQDLSEMRNIIAVTWYIRKILYDCIIICVSRDAGFR